LDDQILLVGAFPTSRIWGLARRIDGALHPSQFDTRFAEDPRRLLFGLGQYLRGHLSCVVQQDQLVFGGMHFEAAAEQHRGRQPVQAQLLR
jgi:hypothetical protein